MFTDSHCHLTFPEFADQMPQIRAAMAAAQVDRALCICTKLEEFDDVQALAASYDNFWASVGVHPDNEGHRRAQRRRPGAPRRPAQGGGHRRDRPGLLPDGRAQGRPQHLDMEWQRDRFRVHIRAAQQTRKPLIIHTREASADTLAILKEEGEDGSPGAPAACSIASPRPPRWRGRRWTWASTSRFRAS
jgi:TatD DNase family protein